MTKNPLEVSLQQDGVLLVTIQGNLTEENLGLLRDNITVANEFIKNESLRAGKALPVIVDLTNLDRVYSPEAITLLAKFEKNDVPYVTKTACFGADIQVKFAGEIVSAISSRKNIIFCDTRDEAIAAVTDPAAAPKK